MSSSIKIRMDEEELIPNFGSHILPVYESILKEVLSNGKNIMIPYCKKCKKIMSLKIRFDKKREKLQLSLICHYCNREVPLKELEVVRVYV